MEAGFNREQGGLACKLMAALQGAKMAGADIRCTANGTSSLFAFLKVAKPTDSYESPYIRLTVKTHGGTHQEPIDLLQNQFNSNSIVCNTTLITHSASKAGYNVDIYPNPTSASIKVVSNSTKELSYFIKDMVDNTLEIGNLKDKTSIIDISRLVSGNYILVLNDGKTSITKKIIKK